MQKPNFKSCGILKPTFYLSSYAILLPVYIIIYYIQCTLEQIKAVPGLPSTGQLANFQPERQLASENAIYELKSTYIWNNTIVYALFIFGNIYTTQSVSLLELFVGDFLLLSFTWKNSFFSRPIIDMISSVDCGAAKQLFISLAKSRDWNLNKEIFEKLVFSNSGRIRLPLYCHLPLLPLRRVDDVYHLAR